MCRGKSRSSSLYTSHKDMWFGMFTTVIAFYIPSENEQNQAENNPCYYTSGLDCL